MALRGAQQLTLPVPDDSFLPHFLFPQVALEHAKRDRLLTYVLVQLMGRYLVRPTRQRCITVHVVHLLRVRTHMVWSCR